MNGEVVFVLEWEDEEGKALLSLDDGEREIVVPVAALESYSLAWALTAYRRAQGSRFRAAVEEGATAMRGHGSGHAFCNLSRPTARRAVVGF